MFYIATALILNFTSNFNFPLPTAAGPSLLSFSEAETLFHQFGHGLHGLLSKVTCESLSGTRVPRDFIEFPSQVMKNWIIKPEVLKMYARHYETGEDISEEMMACMNAANSFNSGFETVESWQLHIYKCLGTPFLSQIPLAPMTLKK
ncbi:MAG: peptidyl-dipeptidase Dcp [Roseivirga sp.]|jgi:peptidyl-dipeptidase Dcp